jgi:hypothetical protein
VRFLPAGPVAGRVRWVSAGLADQLVIAAANAGNTVLALALLSPERAGSMLLCISFAYLALGINRAFVGDVLLAQASRLDGEEHRRLVRHGLTAALTVGVTAGVILALIGVSWPHSATIDLRDCLWVAPFMPAILVHDTCRYTYLSERRPERALGIDLIWVGTQMTVVAATIVAGVASGATLLVSWGVGAAAGATTFMIKTGLRPWQGSPRRWIAQTKRLSGWFTATAVVAQLQIILVGFLVAAPLGPSRLAALRGAQTAILQPVQNFVTAFMGLLVPRGARLAASPGGARQLKRQTLMLAAVFAGLGVLLIAIMVPLGHAVLVHSVKFAPIVPLALPVAIQAAIYLAQIPFTAAMRGMHRARLLFLQYVLFSVASLGGLVIGARSHRLVDAVWGLTTGTVIGFVVMVVLYQWSVRHLGGRPDGAGPDDAAGAEGPLDESLIVA